MADYLQRIIPQLDKHLVLHLLEFLETNKVFPEQDLLKAKFDVVSKTNMLDFAIEIYQKLHNTADAPQDLEAKRTAVITEYERRDNEATAITSFLAANEAAVTEAIANKQFNFSFVESRGITEAQVKSLYHLAKFQYETGNYSEAATNLARFRDLSNDVELTTAALWGILGGQILSEQWDAAAATLNQLKDLIDSKSFVQPLTQLQQRSWLIHWSLFVFFKHPQGRSAAIDWFFSERYLNVIQTTCPHILRYLTVAVITNKKRRNALKDLAKVIEQETYQYTDSVTSFVEALYVQFDFDAAEAALRLAEQDLEKDYFAHSLKEDFVENARLAIFETYCRIHSCIDLKMLSEKLGMPQEKAEIWIVNLIRNARLDAKIDSQANQVLLGSQVTSPYQQLIDKTKGLALRSVVQSNHIEKARSAKNKKTAAAAAAAAAGSQLAE